MAVPAMSEVASAVRIALSYATGGCYQGSRYGAAPASAAQDRVALVSSRRCRLARAPTESSTRSRRA